MMLSPLLDLDRKAEEDIENDKDSTSYSNGHSIKT